MSMVVSHDGGSLYCVTFHSKRGGSRLGKGPKYHTKLHYELNDNLRVWVLRHGLENIMHTGMLQCWLQKLINAAVFTAQPATTSESTCLIRFDSYPLLCGLFI
jgi:hypothetical protein